MGETFISKNREVLENEERLQHNSFCLAGKMGKSVNMLLALMDKCLSSKNRYANNKTINFASSFY